MNELRYARHRFVCCFKVWGTQTVSQDRKYLHIQSEVPIFPTPNVTVNPTINIKPDLSDPTLPQQE